MINTNRKNFLTRVLDVQKVYLEHKSPGVTNVWIYETHIFPRFHISKVTFYKYLGINAKHELAKINEKLSGLGVAAMFLVLVSGCVNPRRLQDEAIRQYPIDTVYQVRTDTFLDWIDLPGEIITLRDTVDCPPADTITRQPTVKTITLPPKRLEVKVPYLDTTAYLRYTAVEAKLQAALRECEKSSGDADLWRRRASERMRYMFYAVLALLIVIGVSVYRALKKQAA